VQLHNFYIGIVCERNGFKVISKLLKFDLSDHCIVLISS